MIVLAGTREVRLANTFGVRPVPQTSYVAVCATVAVLVGSAVLLFARLGHYALWDDEAITAMTARSVAVTGDTSVRVDGHNLLIYRDGLLVKDFKDRFTPPLQFFLLGAVIRAFGDGNLACRLPFAVAGLVTVGVGVRWLWRVRPPPVVWGAAVLLLLGNCEFFLFFRQCRYYGLAMLFTTAAAYLYWFRDGRTRGIAALSAVLALLLASQYLNYAAAVVCLVVDYAVWGRRRRITPPQWAVLLVPQVVVGGVVCSIWNPVARQAAADLAAGVRPAADPHHLVWLADRLHLLWLNVRDGVACDFVVLPLVLAAPVLYFRRRSDALLRGPVAIAAYLVGITAFVGTKVAESPNAEVRYLAPLIPLCVAAGLVGVWGTTFLSRPGRWAVWGVAAASVFVQVDADHRVRVGSSAVAWYHELADPPPEPYTPTIAWVNRHVPAGASVLVRPDYMAYPLMLRAPGPVYAWQLDDKAPAAYSTLPAVHFAGRVPPDYVIAFGRRDPRGAAALADMAGLARRGFRYDLVDTLPYHWNDAYRPELLWHRFTDERAGKVEPDDEVYVYRRRD